MDFISMKGVGPDAPEGVRVAPEPDRDAPTFPLDKDDFMEIIRAIGTLPIPDDPEKMMSSISDRSLHAALVSIVGAYVREDGSVYFDAKVTASILMRAFRFIAENGGEEEWSLGD